MWRAAVPVRRAKYSMRSARSAAYAVELTLRAARDLDYLYGRVHAAESTAAARWFSGLEKAVNSLERFPRRCSVAPESKKTKRSLRHLLHGKKPHVYRVIYEIDEPRMEEGQRGEL
jgi:plasmid stabilization system protein ParE